MRKNCFDKIRILNDEINSSAYIEYINSKNKKNECIKIINDIDFMHDYIWIINKKKERQKLELNWIQLQIDNKIDELINNGIPPRIIILKARQEGVTTYSQGKMISKCVQSKDMNCLIVSHDKDSNNAIFSKSKFMYENLSEEIKPIQRASNAKELIFDKPLHYGGEKEGLNREIVVKIAGKESIGRGDTYSFVHLSEYAFWSGKDSNSPESQLSAIMQAVPKTIDSLAIIESTARGFNDFKSTWDKAVSCENGWTPLFFAWHDDKSYSKDFSTEDERQEFKLNLDDYEKDIKQRFDLTLEQLNWYRSTKKIDCNNNADKMKQENPSYPEEAFIFSGTPIFNNDKVIKRINVLIKKYKVDPLKQGKFIYKFNDEDTQDKIVSYEFKKYDIKEFEGEKVKDIVIYEEPKYGYPYVIGGDTKGEGKDYYTATVINNVTGNRTATLRMQLQTSKPFTHQIYCLGKYYNNAMIGVEMNWNTAPIEDLQRLNYPRQYIRKKYDDISGELQDKLGWKTDGNTRPLIIDREVDFVEDNIDSFNDIRTLREMLTFIEDANGRPDAMSGKHDDLLLSDMIGQEIRKQYTTNIREEPEVPRKKLIDQLRPNKFKR